MNNRFKKFHAMNTIENIKKSNDLICLEMTEYHQKPLSTKFKEKEKTSISVDNQIIVPIIVK